MGTRLKIFIARLKSGSVRRLFSFAALAAKEADRNPIPVFFDVIYCIFRYGVGYQDYRVFGFAKRSAAQRRTYFTYGHNVTMTRMLNDPEWCVELDDKSRFYTRFRAYMGRDWMDLRRVSAQQLAEFCRGKKDIFVKVMDDFGGAGAERIPVSADTDFEKLYARLTESRQFLVEELICQHPQMNLLCPDSVNTIRIVTVATEQAVEIAYALVRIGHGGKAVDNVCAGGMYTVVDENGVLPFPAFCDRDACYYEAHPVTGTPFPGFRIPYYPQALELCRRAAREVPQLGYVGWDVAITPDGPVMVEGNNFPGYDMPQNWKFCPDGIGLLPRMEKLAGREIRRD